MSYIYKLPLFKIKNIFLSILQLGCSIYASMAFCFHDATGHFVSSTALDHQWVIVNYWADWCHSCLEEVPELNKFYKNQQGNHMLVLGVNYDQLPMPALGEAIQRLGIHFPVLQEDPAKKWDLDEVTVLPTTYVINPEGVVVQKIIGPNTEQSLLKVVYHRLYGKNGKNEKNRKNEIDTKRFLTGPQYNLV